MFLSHRAGFAAALPYLAMAIVVQVGGQVADYMRRRGITSTTSVRKICTGGGKTIILFRTLYFIESACGTEW